MECQAKKHLDRFLEIKSFVEQADDFLITTHIRSDGDSITSILLFASILRFLKKRFCVYVDDEIPRKLNFLPGIKTVENGNKEGCAFQPRCLVVMDCSNLDRIGCVKKYSSKDSIIINIDHHPGNQFFGQFNLVDSTESSTVEIVYTLFSQWNIPLSPETATLIYTGIMSDTGKFVFPNTTYRSLSICAEMVKHGAKPDVIASNLYFRNSIDTLKALAAALNTLEFYCDGAISSIHLSCKDLTQNGEVDTEGFVDYLLTIEDTEVVFFMLEEKEDFYRVSFRSKRKVDVNEVSKYFNGGGHSRASGCCIEGKLDDVKNRILNRIKIYL
jgi:phosphoesterase RecJ-like protein